MSAKHPSNSTPPEHDFDAPDGHGSPRGQGARGGQGAPGDQGAPAGHGALGGQGALGAQGAAGRQRTTLAAGPLASLDTTLPPTPLRDLLAADGASVYVYSHDDALIRTAEEAAGEHFPVSPVRAWAELLRSIGGKCRIVLLDADAVPGGLPQGLTQLEKAAISPIVLVAASREQSQRLMGMLSERRIHRLLIKPAAVGITRLLLESAVTRYLQLREGRADASAHAPFEAAGGARGAARWPLWAAVGVGVAGLAAAALVGLGIVSVPGTWRDGASAADPAASAGPAASASGPRSGAANSAPRGRVIGDSTAGAGVADANTGVADANTGVAQANTGVAAANGVGGQTPTGSATAAFEGPFADRLREALRAEQEGRVASPPGESALDLYAAILRDDPGNAAASARLDALLEQLFAAAESDLLSGKLDEAAAALESVRRVQPSSGRLSFLDTQLAKAREPGEPRQGPATVARAGGDLPGGPGGPTTAGGSPAEARSSATAAPSAGTGSALSVPSGALVGGTVPRDAVPTGPAVDAGAGAPSELARALTLGRGRLEAAALLEPSGDSARDYLARAEALAPDDPGVAALRTDLATALTAAAGAAIGAGDLEQARTMAAEAEGLGADAGDLATLEADLEAAERRQEEARRIDLLTIVDRRLGAGQIVGSGEDGALRRLAALQALQPPMPGLEVRWQRARSAVVQQVRAAIAAGDWATADTWTTALAAVDPAPQTAAGLREDLTVARRTQEYLTKLAEPGELRLVESPPLEYPVLAERRGIEGWAEVEFVVGADGRTRDVVVVNAQPRNTFDSAAIQAVSGQRYEPFVQDGHTYERRARIRITFQLQ